MQATGRIKRALHAVLMLDKAPGASSNAVLQQAKQLFRAAKAGHAGTLDPLASGLLPVMFGDATKFSSDLLEADKTYEAEIRLGISTTTADAEGEVVASRPVCVSSEQLDAALARFRGEIQQTPPMYSALKHAGKPLYAYARAGIAIERAPRTIRISALDLLRFDGVRLALRLTCSKGTYVRSIAHDLGEALDCGAHLVGLRRTAVGRFGIGCAYSLDALTALDDGARDGMLLAVDALLQDLPSIVLEPVLHARFVQGQAVAWSGHERGRARVYGVGGRFLGLADVDAGGMVLPKRVVAQV